MKLNRQYFIGAASILAISISIILSCKKGDNSKITMVTENATVIFRGDTAADGCGWLIKTDLNDSTYNAPNLPSQYQIDKLKVHMVYHKLASRYYCGQLPAPQNHGITEIQLDSIKTK